MKKLLSCCYAGPQYLPMNEFVKFELSVSIWSMEHWKQEHLCVSVFFFYSVQNNKLLPLAHDFEVYACPSPVKNIFASIDTRE